MALWEAAMTIRRALLKADIARVARDLNLPIDMLEAFAIGNGQLPPDVLDRLAKYLVEVLVDRRLDPLKSPDQA